MFLFNRLKIGVIKDQSLIHCLKKWFNITSNNYRMHSPMLYTKFKMLDNIEASILASYKIDLNFLKLPVQIGQTLRLASLTYNAHDYNIGGNKRCNFAVKYLYNNNTFEFGLIRYFVKINNQILVAISNFKIVNNIITRISCRTSMALIGIKNSGVIKLIFRRSQRNK